MSDARIRTPCCPMCGALPDLVAEPLRAFCGTEDCAMVCWDMDMPADEILRDIHAIDLSGETGASA